MRSARFILTVAAGGALGSIARHAVSMAGVAALGPVFPWSTLAANVAGSFLVGLLLGLRRTQLGDPLVRAFLLPGFCGGFTTFSMFSLETTMLAERSLPLAASYAGASVLLWLVSAWLGQIVGRQVERRKAG